MLLSNIINNSDCQV